MPTPLTELNDVRALVADTGGGTSANRGEELSRFVKEHGFRDCLELGFYQGVGSVYIAAALESSGAGTLTGVDLAETAELKPGAADLLERAGLSQRVNLVFEDGGYVWFLYRTLREQLREDRVEPLYDFVFLDGAHTWGRRRARLRVRRPAAQVRRLSPVRRPRLAPGRSRQVRRSRRDPLAGARAGHLGHARRDRSHLRRVAHRRLGGWARKSLSGTPQVRTVVKRDLLGQVRELGRIARSKVRQ